MDARAEGDQDSASQRLSAVAQLVTIRGSRFHLLEAGKSVDGGYISSMKSSYRHHCALQHVEPVGAQDHS